MNKNDYGIHNNNIINNFDILHMQIKKFSKTTKESVYGKYLCNNTRSLLILNNLVDFNHTIEFGKKQT